MKKTIFSVFIVTALAGSAFAVPTVPTTTGSMTSTIMGTGYSLEATGEFI